MARYGGESMSTKSILQPSTRESTTPISKEDAFIANSQTDLLKLPLEILDMIIKPVLREDTTAHGLYHWRDLKTRHPPILQTCGALRRQYSEFYLSTTALCCKYSLCRASGQDEMEKLLAKMPKEYPRMFRGMAIVVTCLKTPRMTAIGDLAHITAKYLRGFEILSETFTKNTLATSKGRRLYGREGERKTRPFLLYCLEDLRHPPSSEGVKPWFLVANEQYMSFIMPYTLGDMLSGQALRARLDRDAQRFTHHVTAFQDIQRLYFAHADSYGHFLGNQWEIGDVGVQDPYELCSMLEECQSYGFKTLMTWEELEEETMMREDDDDHDF